MSDQEDSADNKTIPMAPDLEAGNYSKLNNLLDKTMIYSSFIKDKLPDPLKGTTKAEDGEPGEKRKRDDSSSSKKELAVPNLLAGGTLRPYQLVGVNWLISLFTNGVNGILADEMGLGKTIITIGFLAHLWEKKIHGPFLVVAPLSTLANWDNECRKWLPSMPTLLYHGSKEEREQMRAKWDRQAREAKKKGGSKTTGCIITSYDIAMNDLKWLLGKKWKYLVVDEAHRLKNFECKLIKQLKQLDTANRLLLTGTPLQNNLAELWSLLNFILPDIFDDLDSFKNWFNFDSVETEDEGIHILHSEQQNQVISKLHDIMRPFMLRRLKTDAGIDLPKKRELVLYCALTPKQHERYMAIKDKNLDTYLQKETAKGNATGTLKPARLLNIMMQLRKVCNHPFLFEQFDPFLPRTETETVIKEIVEEYDIGDRKPYKQKRKIVETTTKEICNYDHNNAEDRQAYHDALISECGKFGVLDRMLPVLKRDGHKVLIFSQMTSLLDLLEDYLDMTDFRWCRIDGSLPQKERQARIDSFNKESDMFLFLLSTRAGGLGINLTAADTVIIYDSDWNPQADLQAQDRCHRIGQTRPVVVYRMITANTVESKLLKRATAKLKLEHIVIEKGKFHSRDRNTKKFDAKELEEVLKLDPADASYGHGQALTDDLLKKLLNREHVMQMMEKKTKEEKKEVKKEEDGTPTKKVKTEESPANTTTTTEETKEEAEEAASADEEEPEKKGDGAFEFIEELPTLF
eukprot:TRINITY_DN64314_c0_g1_i1.p1 TRINITY_DN64314_c0_g1~~TRINITY_DN64314_c0_g1_i1.p1  ORF type:complete len:745 (-),score=164.56 TRINITY_DN64314_c0_g1_i1:1998-4232(-)